MSHDYCRLETRIITNNKNGKRETILIKNKPNWFILFGLISIFFFFFAIYREGMKVLFYKWYSLIGMKLEVGLNQNTWNVNLNLVKVETITKRW